VKRQQLYFHLLSLSLHIIYIKGAMDGIQFADNSREMFNQVCNASPWFVRHFTRNGLVKGLQEMGVDTVTEQDIYAVCRKVTPEKYLPKTLEILDQLKTT
jgi:hypothetical protein